jgi:hypothetical protein
MHVMSSDENHPSATSTSTPIQTSVMYTGINPQPIILAQDKGISHFYCYVLLTPPTGNSVSVAIETLADLIQNLSPEAAAKVVSLQGKYSTCFIHILSVISFFF